MVLCCEKKILSRDPKIKKNHPTRDWALDKVFSRDFGVKGHRSRSELGLWLGVAKTY